MRRAGRDWLSLALMDARNRTLRWATEFERAGVERAVAAAPPTPDEVDPPAWTIGHAAWFQEAWIARNVQRQRGPACDPTAARLASIDPVADARYDPALATRAARWRAGPPDWAGLRRYLADTIEVTLELLAGADDSDAALYFYRLALLQEDACGEQLAVVAQLLGVGPEAPAPEPAPGGPGRPAPVAEGTTARAAAADPGPWPRWTAHPVRPPLLLPATRWTLGRSDEGFVFDHERAPHEVHLPEYEIDAQPVTWAQFAEFVEDGGYDEERWWSAEGWAWLQRDGRRTPRHVLQMRQGVLVQRFGRAARLPLGQAAMHVNAHEAEAWCRWAGRRLPGEAEWEVAAHQGASRGFRWGEVHEWTATTFRAWPGYAPHAWLGTASAFGRERVLRGASAATHGRLRDPRLRSHRPPADDSGFTGFRSCAL